MASGVVEPIAAALTILFANVVSPILPYVLAFAAGAMIYVVASELLPESGEGKNVTAIAAIVGFSVMMLMDTFFG